MSGPVCWRCGQPERDTYWGRLATDTSHPDWAHAHTGCMDANRQPEGMAA